MSDELKTDPVATEERDAEISKLAAIGVRVRPKHAWMKTFGRAKDDPYFESAVRFGAQWRAEENGRSIEGLDAGS
ncbi:MAG: hypothetical protein QOE70_2374 [Chthoniobacter sp.]|nr:hypothetical protein [Chthoniobacter sp.]